MLDDHVHKISSGGILGSSTLPGHLRSTTTVPNSGRSGSPGSSLSSCSRPSSLFAFSSSGLSFSLYSQKPFYFRYIVPDVPEALSQRIQREAFICNELTIRDEKLSIDHEEEENIVIEEDVL